MNRQAHRHATAAERRLYAGRPRVTYKGSFAQFVVRGRWEYIERRNCRGAVVIIAVTDEDRLVLTEQFRVPVQRSVIELPAGLIGDKRAHRAEAPSLAARRELLEETGYHARRIVPVAQGPTTAGLTSEQIWIVRADGLTKRGAGGGDGHEIITVHEVPLSSIHAWLKRMQVSGRLVDIKIFAGLELLKHGAASRARR